MCGIIGFAGKTEAVPILLDGLERLEYRGYDSAGVAVVSADGRLQVKRAKDVCLFCGNCWTLKILCRGISALVTPNGQPMGNQMIQMHIPMLGRKERLRLSIMAS